MTKAVVVAADMDTAKITSVVAVMVMADTAKTAVVAANTITKI